MNYKLASTKMAQLPDSIGRPSKSRDIEEYHGGSGEGSNFVSDAVENALIIHGMQCSDEPWSERPLLLELFHQGAIEGTRYHTLLALLIAARKDGATVDEIKSLATSFASRCFPTFPENEAQSLAKWITKRIHPWDLDVEAEGTGPSLAAWEASVWNNDQLESLTSTDANGAPIFFPLYVPFRYSTKSGTYKGKIDAPTALATWYEENRQDSWNTNGPLVSDALESMSLCGRSGVRKDTEHRTESLRRVCRNPLHDKCLTGIQHKSKKLMGWEPDKDPIPGWISESIPNAAHDAKSLLNGATTFLSVSVPVEWPYTENELEIAHHHIKDVCDYRTQGLPDGALVALRFEPFRNCLTALILAPGLHEFTQNHRGRPPKYPVTVIGHYDGESGLAKWLEYSGGAWVGYIPDDENAADAMVTLLIWCHRRSRTWGVGKLGKILSKVRLIHPCPVCGAPTRDDGYYDHTRHERIFTVDSQGREYWAVRDKPPNTSSGGT